MWCRKIRDADLWLILAAIGYAVLAFAILWLARVAR